MNVTVNIKRNFSDMDERKAVAESVGRKPMEISMTQANWGSANGRMLTVVPEDLTEKVDKATADRAIAAMIDLGGAEVERTVAMLKGGKHGEMNLHDPETGEPTGGIGYYYARPGGGVLISV